MSQVIPQLYVGSIQAAESIHHLKDTGITHIIQAMGGMDPMYPKDFTYKVLNIRDSPTENIERYFENVVQWISQAMDKGGKILVHCWSGVSRSPSIIIAFLMYKLALTLDSAVLTVRKARGVIYPNPGFKKQLKSFERKLKLLRYDDNQQARFLEDYTTVSNRMKKAQIDMVTAGLSSDFY